MNESTQIKSKFRLKSVQKCKEEIFNNDDIVSRLQTFKLLF